MKLLHTFGKIILCLTITFISLSNIQAAYLTNIDRTLIQPNGDTLQCLASGDEYYNWLHDANGYTIVQNVETGYFVYANLQGDNLVPTDLIAGKSNPSEGGLQPFLNISPAKRLAKRKTWEDAIPKQEAKRGKDHNHGTINNLVVFIRFSDDVAITKPFSTIETMFEGSETDNNSMRDYFLATSYNQLIIDSHYYPEPDGENIMSYQDIHPRNYYRPYSANNPEGYQEYERNEREFALLERASNYIAPYVSETIDLDYNSDGNIDNVCFIIKGAVGDWADLLWPHRWSLFDRTVNINGKRVYDFNFQLEGSPSYFHASVLCHEMFHSLGAPDLYHYYYGTELSAVGTWDLMCSNTQPPQHSGAYMKWKYGNWIDEIPEITEYGTYTLNSIAFEGNRQNCYKILTNNPYQFYVIEYRNKNMHFETGIPGSGLLIYRIDTRFSGCAGYDGVSEFDEVYIFRPGGEATVNGSIGTAYFNKNINRTEFNSKSDPHPFFTNGTVDETINIFDISEIGNTMQFTYGPKDVCQKPETLTANVVENNKVNLNWEYSEANDMMFNVYRNGEMIASNITETSYTDTDLNDGNYTYYTTALCSAGESFQSNNAEVIIGDYCNVVFDLIDSGHDGWNGASVAISYNGILKDEEITLYSDSITSYVRTIPTGTSVTLNWISGTYDDECSISVSYEGEEAIFSTTATPVAGEIFTFDCNCATSPCIAPENLIAKTNNHSIELSWTTHVSASLFNIYINDEFVGSAEQTTYSYPVSQSGTYKFTVTRVCDAAESNYSNESSASIMTFSCSTPSEVTAIANQEKSIELSWNQPEIGGWLQYDDGILVEAISNYNSFFWGISFTQNELVTFDGSSLEKVSIFDIEAGNYKLLIYENGLTKPDSLILTQEFELFETNEFVDIELDQNILISKDKPLWIVIKSVGNQNPAAAGSYCENPNSCWFSANGNSWQPMTYYNKNISWLLRGYVVKPNDNTNNSEITYQVYRNAEQIASGLSETTYIDNKPGYGVFCYTVTTDCEYIESNASNEACDTINHICDAPESITGGDVWNDGNFGAELKWNKPSTTETEVLESFNVYRSTQDVNYELITTIPFDAAQTDYSFFEEVAIGSYYYKVTANYTYETETCESEAALSAENPQNDFIVIEVTNIDENNTENVHLYPNPTSNNITVECLGMRKVTIYNLVGEIIFSEEFFGNKKEFNLFDYKSGLYLIKIETKNRSIAKRFSVM